MSNKYSENKFKCEYCNSILSSISNLNNHKKTNKKCLLSRVDDNIIKKEDFELKETELSKKYSNIICATIGNKYFTKYL